MSEGTKINSATIFTTAIHRTKHYNRNIITIHIETINHSFVGTFITG